MNQIAQLGADIAKLWSRYASSYLSGVRNTLVLALVATIIGCIIGFICGVLNTIPHAKTDHPVKRFVLALIRVIVRVYVEVFRGTPMVLQAVFVYYGLPYFTGGAMQFKNVWLAAILVVSINTGAYMAETVRGGILSIDPGQTEGAKAIGMNHFQTMLHVILPQVMPGVITGAMLAFTLSLDDFTISYFTTSPLVQNLSTLIYSQARKGIKPTMNALSALMFVVLLVLLLLVNKRTDKQEQ